MVAGCFKLGNVQMKHEHTPAICCCEHWHRCPHKPRRLRPNPAQNITKSSVAERVDKGCGQVTVKDLVYNMTIIYNHDIVRLQLNATDGNDSTSLLWVVRNQGNTSQSLTDQHQRSLAEHCQHTVEALQGTNLEFKRFKMLKDVLDSRIQLVNFLLLNHSI